MSSSSRLSRIARSGKSKGKAVGKELLAGIKPYLKQLVAETQAQGTTVGQDLLLRAIQYFIQENPKIILQELSRSQLFDNLKPIIQTIAREVADFAKAQGKDIGEQALAVAMEVAAQKLTGKQAADILGSVGTTTKAENVERGRNRASLEKLQAQCQAVGQVLDPVTGQCVAVVTGNGATVPTKPSKPVTNLPVM